MVPKWELRGLLRFNNMTMKEPLLRFDFSVSHQYNVFSVIEMDENKDLIEEDIEPISYEPLAGQISMEELIAELRLA